MAFDFSKPETQEIFRLEVKKRMDPPFSMSRMQAEMLVAVLMWSPPKSPKFVSKIGETVELPDQAEVTDPDQIALASAQATMVNGFDNDCE
jgi:hypothetical protein